MSEKIDRVAKAIYYAENSSMRPEWDREPLSVQDHLRHKARAAIAATSDRAATELLEVMQSVYAKVMAAGVGPDGRIERLSRADTDAMRDAIKKAQEALAGGEQATAQR